jgi:hypothetical protein
MFGCEVLTAAITSGRESSRLETEAETKAIAKLFSG